MRHIIAILLIFIHFNLFAQKADSKSLEVAVAGFDKALLSRDTVALKHLSNDKLSYGHSNGWIQSERDMINDLYNGKLTYKKISPKNTEIIVEGNTASVRMNSEIEVEMGGKPLQLNLKVLQVWIWKDKHWELFARQSVKIN